MATCELDGDLSLALSLQAQFDMEVAVSHRRPSTPPQQSAKKGAVTTPRTSQKSVSGILNVIDPSWELVDPTPDIHALFVEFNKTFFWDELNSVEVKWSAQLTTAAGNCAYNKRAGSCLIKLSSPLLRLRPRKDLVQTLLHEMIHAYLFVTKNNRDHSGHGPEFVKHMERLNRRTGANISIYHSFHDEVDLYKVHWWQCNGPCKHRRPYYGLVKSARNRAPGPSYNWWTVHQSTCSGTFVKIKGPEIKNSNGTLPKTPTKNQPLSPLKSSSTKSTFIPFTDQGHVLGGLPKNDDSKVGRLLAIRNIVEQGAKISTPAFPKKGTLKKRDIASQSRLENFFHPAELSPNSPLFSRKQKPNGSIKKISNSGTASKKALISERLTALKKFVLSDSSDEEKQSDSSAVPIVTVASGKRYISSDLSPDSPMQPRKLELAGSANKNRPNSAKFQRFILSDSSDDDKPNISSAFSKVTSTFAKRTEAAGPSHAATKAVRRSGVGQPKLTAEKLDHNTDDKPCSFIVTDKISKGSNNIQHRKLICNESSQGQLSLPSPPFFVIDSSDDEICPPSPRAKNMLSLRVGFSTPLSKKFKSDSEISSSVLKSLPQTPAATTNQPIARSFGSLANGRSEFINCPSCSAQVLAIKINEHLDGCLQF